MLFALSIVHEGETVARIRVVEAVPSLFSASAREVFHGTRELLRSVGVEAVLHDVMGGGGSLGCAEEAELVKKLGAPGIKEREDLWVHLVAEKSVADLSADDEAVLFDGCDSGDFLDGRGCEAFLVEGWNERGPLEP